MARVESSFLSKSISKKILELTVSFNVGIESDEGKFCNNCISKIFWGQLKVIKFKFLGCKRSQANFLSLTFNRKNIFTFLTSLQVVRNVQYFQTRRRHAKFFGQTRSIVFTGS